MYSKKIEGCIAAHTITNLFYILRKNLSIDRRRIILLQICKIFSIIGIDSDKLESALQNDNISDFEDCLQVECANAFYATYIVTRNEKDFVNSPIPCINPNSFLKLIENK